MSKYTLSQMSYKLGFAAAVLTVLTAGQSVWSAEESTTRLEMEEVAPQSLSELGLHINPQIGMSSMEYSGQAGNSKQQLAGGVTSEFGEGIRRFETGFLVMQAGGQITAKNGSEQEVHSTYLTLPMVAKFRVMQMPAQSWYLKGGFITALGLSTLDAQATNNLDILASLGLSGRFAFTRTADFIVEATYNRGMLDAVRTQGNNNDFNQGALVLAGLSFKL